MVFDQLDFEHRLRRLMRKHRAMSRGYTTSLRPDGLIVAKPKRRASPVSLRSVILFLVAFVLFKGFLIANIGPQAYSERVARLMDGTAIEQAGGVVMQIDPLSQMVSEKIGPILR